MQWRCKDSSVGDISADTGFAVDVVLVVHEVAFGYKIGAAPFITALPMTLYVVAMVSLDFSHLLRERERFQNIVPFLNILDHLPCMFAKVQHTILYVIEY